MCGIIGAFNLGDAPEPPAAEVRAGMAAMLTRGPDAGGFYQERGVALGHRRLAIIDPASGRQPMTDPATGVTLVFNGELYNFREIRARLERAGQAFTTNSDTEVLLRAWLEWGVDCPHEFSGMFAFAIYDPRNATLFLARDRIGVKPLFYAVKDQRLFFASTVPALRCFSAIDSAIDLAGISHYLTTIRTTFGERTLFRDIRTLLPGELMLARRPAAAPVIKRYWDFPMPAPAEKDDPGIDVAADQVATLLDHAVREQLISDVPLGGFLSGGLDSSIIAGLAHRAGRFDAYSVGYDLAGYNEWPFVREAAAHYRMTCREVHLAESDYAADWAGLIRYKGLPVSTPNEIPIQRLARELRRDFTVALTGEGADEIFGGYHKIYFSAFDYERARHAPPAPGDQLTELDQAIQRLYRRPYLLCRADHFFLHSAWLPFRQKHDLLQPEIWTALEADRALFAFYDGWFERLAHCSTFDAYMQIHARINLEGLLSRVDSSTMAASVEARVPFTDHRLVEYVFRLPDRHKIWWTSSDATARAQNMNIEEIADAGLLESKILLRRAFQDAVPASILRRPKMSFPAPVLEWFNTSLRSTAEHALRESELGRRLFRPRQIDRLLATAAYQPSAMALWPAVNLCLWQLQTGATMP